MNINYIAVLVAAVAQFIFSAIWYMPLFGKIWGRMHGFDKVSAEEQKVMTKKMMPLLVVQFVFTLVTSAVFVYLVSKVSTDLNIYCLAALFWLGFIVPTQGAAVLFGGTDPKWVVKKTLIMALGSLGCMMILAFVINAF
jgi:hypothetical protein